MRAFVIFLSLLVYINSQSFSKYEIQLKITGDFPKGVYISPQTITLNGKDIRKHTFPPGNYKLYIAEPGYFSLSKKIIIPLENKTFAIQEVLTTKPRKVAFNITYDLPPPATLAPEVITLTPISDTSQQKIEIRDMIKPNTYRLRITKPAYETIDMKQHIWPDDRPYVIDQKLRAKQVPISFEITHDIPPSPQEPYYRVSIISKKTHVLYLTDDLYPVIRPGLYDVKITHPGYHTIAFDLEILPGTKPIIKKCLIAKKRGIAFDTHSDTKLYTMFDAVSIVDLKTQRQLTHKDKFQPQQRLHLQVKFKRHATIEKIVDIVPGEGKQVVKLRPQLLRTVLFSTKIHMDKHLYCETNYGKVEDHHMQRTPGKFSCSYQVMVPARAKSLRIAHKYFFSEIPIVSKEIPVIEMLAVEIKAPTFDKISIHMLILYIQDLITNNKALKALIVCEDLVAKHSKKLSICDQQHKELLIRYLEKWKVNWEKQRSQKIIAEFQDKCCHQK